MAYLLRSLIVLMLFSIALTTGRALGWIDIALSHIHLGIIAFIYTIFTQAFVMFYFIGVSRFVKNIHFILYSEKNLDELFTQAPDNLGPYIKKVAQWDRDAERAKRQNIPWVMLILVLGMIGFLLGGAHDTGLVDKTTHSGVAYGFIAALLIGFGRQWYYLGKNHFLLRKVKSLFQIPDGSM